MTDTETDTAKRQLLYQIERWKAKAELFITENTPAFIVDTEGNYYFCHILLVGEASLQILSFKGNRAGQKDTLLWVDLVRLSKYQPINPSEIIVPPRTEEEKE